MLTTLVALMIGACSFAQYTYAYPTEREADEQVRKCLQDTQFAIQSRPPAHICSGYGIEELILVPGTDRRLWVANLFGLKVGRLVALDGNLSVSAQRAFDGYLKVPQPLENTQFEELMTLEVYHAAGTGWQFTEEVLLEYARVEGTLTVLWTGVTSENIAVFAGFDVSIKQDIRYKFSEAGVTAWVAAQITVTEDGGIAKRNIKMPKRSVLLNHVDCYWHIDPITLTTPSERYRKAISAALEDLRSKRKYTALATPRTSASIENPSQWSLK